MTLQFVCAEIERLHLQIRRQQNEVFTLQRRGIGIASAELLLARMQASVDALCICLLLEGCLPRGAGRGLEGACRDVGRDVCRAAAI
jgi:hypothetical protein